MSGIYGLSGSGMDIDDLVKGMMKTQQAKYDKLYKQKTVQTWKKEAYNDIYKSAYKFRYNTLTDYKLQSNMSAKATSSTDSSVVTAKALGDAVQMTHDVSVKQLASSAYLQSKEKITRGDSEARAKTIENAQNTYIKKAQEGKADEAQQAYETAYNAAISTNPDDEDAAKAAGNNAKQGFLDQIAIDVHDDAVKAGEDAGKAYDQSTSITLSDIAGTIRPSDAEDTDIALAFSIDDGINGKKYVKYTYKDLEDGKTLNDLVSDINKLGTNVQASYDNNNDSFSLYNKIGGENNKIELNIESSFSQTTSDGKTVDYTVSETAMGKSANFINNLHLAQYNSETKELGEAKSFTAVDGKYNSIEQTGKSAIAIIDGKEYTSESNSITAGSVIYTLNKVSSTDSSGKPESTKVTINSDTDTIVKYVKKFVEDYNTLLDQFNTQIYAEYDSTYLPLTDDEKSEMTDEQIKKWEEKSKTGLLSKDSILKDTVNQMRSALGSIISGTGNDYNSFASLGITTTDYTEHGKIELDEEKLRKALDKDPDAVYKIFVNSTDSDGEPGIIQKLSDTMNSALAKIKSQAGTTADVDDQSYVGSKIDRLNDQMTTLKARMEKQQTSLYKRFNAMETAIAQMNQQASYLTSAFGS